MGCIQQNKSININQLSNNNNILIKKALNNKKNNIKKYKNFNNNFNNIQNFNKKNIKNLNFESEISIIDKITNNKWLKILDYLNYNDLKEVGKVNKFFNNNVKNKDILLKFFQKRKKLYSIDSSNLDNKPTISENLNMNKNDLSFSILQKENSLIIDEICDYENFD
jgi:hypothetical protein